MKKTIAAISTLITVLALTACSASSAETISGQTVSTSNTAGVTTVSATGAATVEEALAENSEVHEDASDYTWEDADIIPITLNGDSMRVDGEGVSVDGSTATITAAGTYSLSGSLDDGQIIVNTEAEGIVRLILNGVELRNSSSAPLYILKSDETVIYLPENTTNLIADGADYVSENPDTDEPNAAIFSAADLTIFGSGTLTVQGNNNDGIASKDGLIIASGTLTVSAVDDGMRGKDYLVVEDGVITVEAGGDGLKADNAEDPTKGFISIQAGVLNIIAGGDAITAQTDVMISGGEITVRSGGGSSAWADETISAKGIKGVVSVNIDGGTFAFDCADDAIHSNGSITINNGSFSIASGDDGMHADATLTINGGNIQITQSYEGLESAVITINGGEMHILSSDDGINVAAGNDASGMNPGFGGGRGGGPGQDAFNYTGDYYLYINGGYIWVDANGDGIDINGAVVMTDGVLLVNGPTENMNGALDYDGGFSMSGGFLAAAGSAGMAQAPDGSSSQNALLINFTGTLPAGTLVNIKNSAGEDILTFAATKQYQSLAFSSPELVSGETYTVSYGGSSSGSLVDGLFQDGNYSGGTELTSFTVSGVVTMIGSGGGGGRMRP
jgi:hypothetical protein